MPKKCLKCGKENDNLVSWCINCHSKEFEKLNITTNISNKQKKKQSDHKVLLTITCILLLLQTLIVFSPLPDSTINTSGGNLAYNSGALFGKYFIFIFALIVGISLKKKVLTIFTILLLCCYIFFNNVISFYDIIHRKADTTQISNFQDNEDELNLLKAKINAYFFNKALETTEFKSFIKKYRNEFEKIKSYKNFNTNLTIDLLDQLKSDIDFNNAYDKLMNDSKYTNLRKQISELDKESANLITRARDNLLKTNPQFKNQFNKLQQLFATKYNNDLNLFMKSKEYSDFIATIVARSPELSIFSIKYAFTLLEYPELKSAIDKILLQPSIAKIIDDAQLKYLRNSTDYYYEFQVFKKTPEYKNMYEKLDLEHDIELRKLFDEYSRLEKQSK